MALTRRDLIRTGALGAGALALGNVGALFTAPGASMAAVTGGYGRILPDPAGLLDLPKGFRYRDTLRTNDGISRVVLRSQPDVLADIVIRARGPNIPAITLPFDQPVLAQMQRDDGPDCWEASYSPPANKNTAVKYKDKND